MSSASVPNRETAKGLLQFRKASALYVEGMTRREADKVWKSSPYSSWAAEQFLVSRGAGALYREGMTVDEMRAAYAAHKAETE